MVHTCRSLRGCHLLDCNAVQKLASRVKIGVDWNATKAKNTMYGILKSGTQPRNETGHNAHDKKSVANGRGLNRILQTRPERQNPKRCSKRPVWHANGGVARTVSRVDFGGDAANGAHEKEQPNDGTVNR